MVIHKELAELLSMKRTNNANYEAGYYSTGNIVVAMSDIFDVLLTIFLG